MFFLWWPCNIVFCKGSSSQHSSKITSLIIQVVAKKYQNYYSGYFITINAPPSARPHAIIPSNRSIISSNSSSYLHRCMLTFPSLKQRNADLSRDCFCIHILASFCYDKLLQQCIYSLSRSILSPTICNTSNLCTGTSIVV